MGNMKALLFPILKELTVWTEGNRAASARLLRTCLVYSEAKITRHVHRIVPILVKVIADPVVAPPLAQCCTILARFVEPEYFMAALLPAITVEESNEACTSAVRVLRHLVEGCAQGGMGEFVPDILQVLLAPDLLRTNHAPLKEAAVMLLDSLLTSAVEDATAHTSDLVVALVHFATPVPALLPVVQARVRPSPPLLAPSVLVRQRAVRRWTWWSPQGCHQRWENAEWRQHFAIQKRACLCNFPTCSDPRRPGPPSPDPRFGVPGIGSDRRLADFAMGGPVGEPSAGCLRSRLHRAQERTDRGIACGDAGACGTAAAGRAGRAGRG